MNMDEVFKNGMWDKLGGDLLHYEYDMKKSCPSIQFEMMFGRKSIKKLSQELQNFIKDFFEYKITKDNMTKEEIIKYYMIEDLI